MLFLSKKGGWMKNIPIIILICFGLLSLGCSGSSKGFKSSHAQNSKHIDKSISDIDLNVKHIAQKPIITIKTKSISTFRKYDEGGHGIALGGRHNTNTGDFTLKLFISNNSSNIEQIGFDIDGNFYKYKNKNDTKFQYNIDDIDGYTRISSAEIKVPFNIIEKMVSSERAIVKINTTDRDFEGNFSLGCNEDVPLWLVERKNNSCRMFNCYVSAFNRGDFFLEGYPEVSVGNKNCPPEFPIQS